MSISDDTQELNSYINNKIDIESVASFKGNEHIVKLSLKFDINKIDEVYENSKKSEFFSDTRFFTSKVDSSIFGLNFKERRGLL